MDEEQLFLYKFLVVILVVAGVYFAAGPLGDKFDELAVEQINLESEIAIKNSYVSNPQVEENLGLFFSVLPSSSREEELGTLITTRADQVGVEILNFQFFEEEEESSRSSRTAELEDAELPEGASYFEPKYTSDTFQVNMSGSLDQALAYIRAFEDGPQFVTVESFNFSEQPSARGDAPGRATVMMKSYYQDNR